MKKIHFYIIENSTWIFGSYWGLLIFISCISCERQSEGSKKAREQNQNKVTAVLETEPVPQNRNADAADDPAIWIHSENPEKSFVIGTDKKGGLATYNLEGKLLNYYPHGNMNNCDLRYGFSLADEKVDILAASNQSSHSISLYKISGNGILDSIHARTIISEMNAEVYGLCLYKSPITKKYYVYINSKAGEVEQWELFERKGKVDAKLVRSFNLGTQTEGMVADDKYATVYIGKEIAGIWKFDAEPDADSKGVFIEGSSEKNRNIKYDIEGLTIYYTDSIKGYLLASSQGNNTYAVFERHGNNKYLGSFRITDGKIDGVEGTDGIDVTSVSLPGFPKGLLLVQDGYNYSDGKKSPQNFKYISWKDIETFLLK